MKFEYAYKTSDGERHTDRMDAPSREDVFATLRNRGIKAIKVVALDGSKANGEVRVLGVRRPVVAVLVIVVAVLAATTSWLISARSAAKWNHIAEHPQTEKNHAVKPLPRQQILGNRDRLTGVATNLFATAEEVYLSQFAEPGRPYSGDVPNGLVSGGTQLLTILETTTQIGESTFTEWVDLVRMTEWIKLEMKTYLRGGGKAGDYIQQLQQRQHSEIALRDKAQSHLQHMLLEKQKDLQAIFNYWLKANARLQSMGIYPLPMPNELRNYQQSLDIDE